MYVNLRQTRRRSRRGLGEIYGAGWPNPNPNSGVDQCSTWDFFFNPSTWKACETAQGQAQIQTVPQNAAAAGYSPSVVAVAQAAANQQSAQVPADVANVAQFYSAGQLLANVQNPSSPFGLPTWVWWVVGGIASVFVLKAVK